MEKSKRVKELLDTEYLVKSILVNKLKEFVRINGDEFTDYDYNEFGIDEGDEEGVTITKVYNFFDNGGCYFPTINNVLPDINLDCETTDELRNELDEHFTYWAFQCLYLEVDEEHGEHLKYYTLYNDGLEFKDGLSEPDHEYVQNLPLNVICEIIDVISHIETKYDKDNETLKT